MLLNIDWLEFMTIAEDLSFIGVDEIKFGEFLFLDRGMGNMVFKRSYEVFYRGESCGYVFCEPRSNVIREDYVQVEISNHVLYSEDWYIIAKGIMEALNLRFNNFSRVDFAVDGKLGVLEFFNNFVGAILDEDKEVLYRKKGKMKLDIGEFDSKRGRFNYIRIGSPKSDKFVVCYDKSREIDKSGKYYIREYWRKNGLVGGGIERLEFRLKSKVLKEVEDLTLEKLTDKEYCWRLLRSFFEKWFEYAIEDGQKNISRKRVLRIFDFPVGGEVLRRVKVPSDVYRAKVVVKDMVYRYYRGELDVGIVWKIVEAYMDRLDLWDWFWDRYEIWKRDCERRFGSVA